MDRRLLEEQLVAEQYRDRASGDAQQSPAPGAAVVNLVGAVSNPPTQAEVQANRDKINELLNSLRNAGSIVS